MRWRAAAVALGLVTAACTGTVQGHGASAVSCPAVFFGVAGSGQGLRYGVPGHRPAGVSATDAQRYGTTVALVKDELARLAGRRLAAATAIDYPALAVEQYLGPTGLTPDLDVSERQGVQALVGRIRAAARGRCATRPVLLSGYSQGAEVVVRAVDQLRLAERRHVAVALFGNPSYQPGLVGDYPGGSAGRGLRPTFLNDAYSLPADVRRRTLDICAPGDPVCGVDPGEHSLLGRLSWVLDHVDIHRDAYAFGRAGYPALAARFLWQHGRA